MSLSRYLLIATLAFCAVLVIRSSYADSSKFKPLGAWKSHSIEVDETSVISTTDKDGDIIKGGVFRITLSKPAATSKGSVKIALHTVIAMCGYDGVIVAHSKTLDEKGATISEGEPFDTYADEKKPGTAATEIYGYLCGKTVDPKSVKDWKQWA